MLLWSFGPVVIVVVCSSGPLVLWCGGLARWCLYCDTWMCVMAGRTPRGVPIFWHIYIRQICLAMMLNFSKNTVHFFVQLCIVVSSLELVKRLAAQVASLSSNSWIIWTSWSWRRAWWLCSVLWHGSGRVCMPLTLAKGDVPNIWIDMYINKHSLRDHDFSWKGCVCVCVKISFQDP